MTTSSTGQPFLSRPSPSRDQRERHSAVGPTNVTVLFGPLFQQPQLAQRERRPRVPVQAGERVRVSRNESRRMSTLGLIHRLLHGDRAKILPLVHLGHFLCSSSPVIPIAPRKGLQAIRRILKLLSSRRDDAVRRPEIARALKTLGTDPRGLSSSQAAALVSAVADPLISFDLYRFLRSAGRDSFRPESSLFCSLISSQLRSLSPCVFRIRFYLGEMKKHGKFPAFEEFKSLFGFAVPLEHFFEEVVQIVGLDSAAFGAAIEVYAEKGLVEEAFGLAERARKEVDGPLSVEFYSSLIFLHRIQGDAKAAMEVFLEMEKKALTPNQETYEALLQILSDAGWMKLCWAILQEMKARFALNLCESSGLNLMRAFLQREMVKEAEWLFREGILSEKESCELFAKQMAEKKLPLPALEFLKTTPHLVSCAETLIKCCGQLGMIQEAEAIFHQVEAKFSGFEAAQTLISSMIFVYARARMKSSAERLWSQLEASEGALTGEPYTWMMSMYGEMGMLDCVEKVFGEWKNSGLTMTVDGYAILVKALVKAGKLVNARDCLREMRKLGFQPTAVICSEIAEGFLRAGLPSQAHALVNEIRVSGSTG